MDTDNAGQNALICEDEGMILMQIRSALRAAGYQVVGEAGDGEAAIEKARELRPDFILMDVKMPRMGGIEATRAILSEQEVPIIVLTAFGDQAAVDRALDAGACAYIVKPVTKEQLIPAVRTALAQYTARKQIEREKQTLKRALKQTITQQTAEATHETKRALRENLGNNGGVKKSGGSQISTDAAGVEAPATHESELLQLTHRLLTSIHEGDVETYRSLCMPDLTCFESDIAPYRIEAIDFHIDMMKAMKSQSAYGGLTRFDMLSPKAQIHGDCAIVTYTRLMTYAGVMPPVFRAFNESRIYVRQDGAWKMAHFHRSEAA